MATPERDTVYTNDGTDRTVYTRESNSTGWFVGIIVALALLAIAYLVFSANSQPSSTTINNTPAVTAPADTGTTPLAPATGTETTPMNTDTAPMTTAPAAPDATTPAEATTAPADTTSAPVASAPAVETSAAPAVSSAPAAQ